MPEHQIVMDASVLVAALQSRHGAAHQLLMRVGHGEFGINVSVPLVLEYEAAAKQLIGETSLGAGDIDAVLDYLCAAAKWKKLSYLWHPHLGDAADDAVLELEVASGSHYIVTLDPQHYRGAEQLGIEVVTPRQFLDILEGK